jgi:hypothetical protein
VEEGDRIAQLIIERIYTPEVQEVTVSVSGFGARFFLSINRLHRIWMRLSEEPLALDRRAAVRCSKSRLECDLVVAEYCRALLQYLCRTRIVQRR